MRKIPVEEAVGEVLCHDMTAILEDGFKGVRFKRGHIITREDIPALLDIGKSRIFVWDPGKDEVHEDDAGLAVTKEICGDNISFTGPSEGKYQLSSKADGLFRVRSDALRLINSVPDFTVACRRGNTAVRAGDQLAGARIVPLVTDRANVDEAVRIAKENSPVLDVLPFRPLKTAIIVTGSEIYNGRIQDRFEPILREKLSKYGARIRGVYICDDDMAMIGSAINDFVTLGAELIFLTGGMSVDPDDLTPGAIKASGARLVAQGVPMQPGNMLTIAYLPQTVLVGVPGASMHSPVTSLDVFLPRIFAGVEIEKADIAALGEGGFYVSGESGYLGGFGNS